MKKLQPSVLLACPEQKKTALHQLAVGKANPSAWGLPVPLWSHSCCCPGDSRAITAHLVRRLVICRARAAR